MAISMHTGNSTKTRSINAIIRPNFQRCPRRGHTCNSFLEDNADGMTFQDRRLETQGLRRCSKRATPFSKEQTIQQKVSMITLGELCDLPKHQLANSFGFKTRKSYYDIRNAVLHGSPADLMPKRTGPHTPPKRTKEVEVLIIRRRFETDENMYDIADVLTQLGFDVSARLVGQVLADYGLSKKNG